MRTTATCPRCDAIWRTETARFCGDCGGPLQTTTHREPDPPRPWVRVALGLVVTVALVGAAFAVGGNSSFRVPQRGADPAVELEPGDLAPEGAPLTDAERAEALAPFDPDRLRCEPEGCERWRVEFPTDPAQPVHAAVVDDLVVVVAAGAEVRAYDLDSGDERWRAAWPGATDPPPTSMGQAWVQSADGDVIVVSWLVSGHVHALDTAGRTLWHASGVTGGRGHITPLGNVVVFIEPTGEVIETETETSQGDVTTSVTMLDDLRVRDAATGTLLWEARSVDLRAWGDGAFVTTDGTTTSLLDARTGEERARRELPDLGWLQMTGDTVLHQPEHDTGNWQLLAGESLEVVAEIGRFDSLMPTQDGSALVGQNRGDRDTGDRILVFETDGTLRWEHELSFPAGSIASCCAQVEGDVLVLPPAAGTTSPLRFDLADGSRLSDLPPRPGAVPAPEGGTGTWWMSPHTALSFDPNGERPNLWHDGYRVVLHGGGSRAGPLAPEPPFVFVGESSLVAVQPVPGD